ncbi:hypothetical protein [cyanobacterium endosymbiont of Epithemia turgida]|nr:hypothetical protein [cyanobacterium endosymbiont of Epithemia turgida]
MSDHPISTARGKIISTAQANITNNNLGFIEIRLRKISGQVSI